MKKTILKGILILLMCLGLLSPIELVSGKTTTAVTTMTPTNIFNAEGIEKVTDPTKQIKDDNTKAILLAQGINPDYVELIQDYALSYDANGNKLEKKSPYARFYKDRISGKEIMETSELPMVNANGSFLDTIWTTKDGENFNAGINQFIASVATNKVTVIAINAQPDGKVKKDNVLTFQPQVYIGVKEVKPISNTPILLPIDPVNSNYQNNNLQWDYGNGITRNLRLIEGSILGYWTFTSNPGVDVRIKYNQTGDYKLNLSHFGIDSDTELVPASAFVADELGRPRVYPFTVSDSATFYPDIHPETTSVDGMMYYAIENQTWATVHDSAATYVDSSDVLLEPYVINSGTNSGTWYQLGRSVVVFPTGNLPDSAIISAATLTLYGYDKGQISTYNPALNVYLATPASFTNLVVNDYLPANFGTTAYCDTSITYANWLTGDPGNPNSFNFNATGIAAISKTLSTAFGLRDAIYDVPNTPPTYAQSKYSYIRSWSSDKGNGYKPTLVVIYSVPPPTVTTQAATLIGFTTAIGNGNVTSIGTDNVTIRGFQWGTATGTYTTNVTELGNWGIGAFTLSLPSLPTCTIIYYRAEAYNIGGWGHGGEVSFFTGPVPIADDKLIGIAVILK